MRIRTVESGRWRDAGEGCCRAVGVEFSVANRAYTTHTDLGGGGEVLVSAGAINSPQILQLSGIGDCIHLETLGLKDGVKHALPGVGQNLRDHLQIRCIYKTKGCSTLNDEMQSWSQKIAKGIQYFVFGTGPLSMAASSGCAFM